MNEKRRIEWFEDRVFVDGKVCVTVNKLPLRRPRFSISIGQKMDEHVSRFLPVSHAGKGKIVVDSVRDVIAKLINEAEAYIQGELQYLEDTWVEDRQLHEARDLSRGKPRARHGLSGGPGSGKTARKRENRRKRMSAK